MAEWPAHLRTARMRSTLAATFAVAIVLIASAIAVVALQRRALVEAIDASLVARANDVSAMISAGTLSERLTVSGGDDTLLQVVDDHGVVVAESDDVEGTTPVSGIRPDPDSVVAVNAMLPGDDDRFRLVALGASSGERRFTVYSAATLEAVDSAAGALIALLSVGVPVLIAGVGLTVWLIVGRTLRPVEEIRSEVASITEEELHRRVPVPEVDDEIGRLASTMNQMLSRLEVSSQQQRRFVADASHELRSPLAAIRSQLEVDLAHPDSANLERTHTEVLDETLRLQRLVEALLLLARSDAGALASSRGTVDVDDVVLEQVRGLIPTPDVAIDATAVTGAQVAASTDELAFVIRNVLENAARYAQSRVEVALVAEDGMAKLTIDDDGPGIADQDRDRVFERFTRLDEARDRAHGGAGLGLAIARDITHHLRGAIEVERSPLGGARFIVSLPVNGA